MVAMVLGNTYTSNLMPPCLKQKKAIRMVCYLKCRDHTTELFYDIELLTIYLIIKLETDIAMYIAFHMKLPYLQNACTYE